MLINLSEDRIPDDADLDSSDTNRQSESVLGAFILLKKGGKVHIDI